MQQGTLQPNCYKVRIAYSENFRSSVRKLSRTPCISSSWQENLYWQKTAQAFMERMCADPGVSRWVSFQRKIGRNLQADWQRSAADFDAENCRKYRAVFPRQAVIRSEKIISNNWDLRIAVEKLHCFNFLINLLDYQKVLQSWKNISMLLLKKWIQ